MSTIMRPTFSTPTPAERIKLLQQQAEQEVDEHFDRLVVALHKSAVLANELEEIGKGFGAISQTAHELAPQIERCLAIATSVRNRRAGR